MTYPADTDPIGSIAPQSDAVEGPPGTWTGGTLDSAADVIEPLRLGTLDIMAYLGLSGDAANAAGNVTQLVKALTLWAASSTASIASASTLTLPTTGAFITVTGTTQINDLALPVSPLTTRLVILKAASDGLVIKNLNHQKLGADVTLNTDQTLVLFCTGSFWYPLGAVSGAALTNPMSALDDMIVGGASGIPARLAKGGDGQVLTVDPATHHVVWANSASGFANPMTSQDDVIVGGTAGTATRLAKGSDGQVLTVDPTTHHLVWATPGGLTNPMTTDDDVIIGGTAGAPARLGKGGDGQVLTVDPATHHIVWANSASGFANPMVAQDDLIVGGTAGTGTRLAKGADAQVLTVDPSTHHLVWRTIPTFGVGQDGIVTGPGSIISGQFLASDGSWASPAGGGFSNPMTTTGDIIKGGVSGAAARLAIGSTGDVLTVVAGAPAWAAPTGGSGGGGLLAFMPTLTPPVLTSLTKINENVSVPFVQDGSTVRVKAGSIESFANVRILADAAVNTHWHFRALVWVTGLPLGAINLCAIDHTASDKFVSVRLTASGGVWQSAFQMFNSPTSYNAAIAGLIGVTPVNPMWTHIMWDGTNMKFGWSGDADGAPTFYVTQPSAVSWTSGHIPTYYGIGVEGLSALIDQQVRILSWEEIALP